MTDIAALKRRAWAQTALSIPALALLLFVPAGTLRYWQGWLFAAVFLAVTAALGLHFIKHDPALIERRMTIGPSAETEPVQKAAMTIFIVGVVLMTILPGLDYRWRWSAVPVWLVLLGNAGVILSFVIFFAVMKQNSYAAATIRVEPGQTLASTGLYGVVRHPMYAGALVLLVCTPLALGSYWTLLLLIPMVPALAWRLIDEERVLLRDLPGYAGYRTKVRYRLVPGFW